ncbi:MAG: PAS domain S-box protein [Deltaproteobacteria bacterium]|nr:PAS domain S-box protein [Deltaproteobacteria bacterium]
MFDELPGWAAYLDRELRYAFVNKAYERFFGKARHEILGKHVREVLGEEMFEERRELLERALRGEPFHVDSRLAPRGDRPREGWSRGRGVPDLDDAGAVRGIIVLSVDITELFETQRQLRRRDDELRALLEVSSEGVAIHDRGMLILVSPQFERMFGYGPGSLAGRSMADLVAPEERGRGMANEARVITAVRSDGSRFPCEVIGRDTTYDGRAVRVAAVRDVTERLRAEAELRRHRDELAQTLKEREVLLREVHHRVKNNLQIISSVINMQQRTLASAAAREALEDCQTRVHAIALIHEQLYRVTDFAHVRVADYVRKLATDVFRAAALGTEIALELELDDIALAIEQAIPCGLVITELIANALKHAFHDRRAGRVRVELRCGPERRVCLAVHDDGAGFALSASAASAASAASTGSLGMQLVASLAEQLGATLTVESDGGARVQLVFVAAA